MQSFLPIIIDSMAELGLLSPKASTPIKIELFADPVKFLPALKPSDVEFSKIVVVSKFDVPIDILPLPEARLSKD